MRPHYRGADMSWDEMVYEDEATLFRVERPRARKQYKCDECLAPIPKGLRYWRAFGVWGENTRTWRAHLRCAAFRSRYNDYLDHERMEPAPLGRLDWHVRMFSDDDRRVSWADRWVKLRDRTHERYTHGAKI